MKITDSSSEIFLVTKQGMCIRFQETDVRATGRASMGVIGMNLSPGDEIIGMQLQTQGSDLLIVSENGMGKRTNMDEFTVQKRGGKGVKCYKIVEKTGDVVGAKAVNDDNEIMMITTEGIIIQLRVQDISTLSRITSGVKLINLDEGVKVAQIAKVREKLSNGDHEFDNLEEAMEEVAQEAVSEDEEEAEENLIDSDTTTEWVAPKLNQLPQFIDVFSGTGTVAASVGANKSVVNDIDVGAACFLYSMSHDSKEVRQRLAQLHNNFVSKDLSEGQELYTAEQWQRHRESKAYEEYLGNQKFEELMVRLRNNYVYIYKKYVQATREVALDFDNDTTKNIEMFYDIGVAWLFLNSFKQKLKKANQFNAIDMDIEAYKKYLHTVLMVKYKDDKKYEKYHQQDESDATFLEKYRIKKSQVKFEKGIKYMDSLKNTIVKNEDFYTVIQGYSGGFIYLDSPYFLTTDYTVPFQDEEHKDMLDILRYADFNWLFSMQYKEIDTDKFNKSEFTKNRKSYQEAGHPLIKNYDYYYNGFVKPFVIKSEMNLLYYETDASKNIEDNNLWVLFFYYKFNNKEMMICNFDSRRNIPYAFEGDKEIGHHIEIMPYNEFLTHLRNRKESSYNELRTEAHNWRKNNIIENYASGARV